MVTTLVISVVSLVALCILAGIYVSALGQDISVAVGSQALRMSPAGGGNVVHISSVGSDGPRLFSSCTSANRIRDWDVETLFRIPHHIELVSWHRVDKR